MLRRLPLPVNTMRIGSRRYTERLVGAPMSSTQPQAFLRPPAEIVYARELDALAANDEGPSPTGWKLSPRSVRTFIVGSDERELAHTWEGKKVKTAITRKFYGDDVLIERAVITRKFYG